MFQNIKKLGPLTFIIVVLLVSLSSCRAQKVNKRSYKDYERKIIQFDQKKYKFRDNYPPVQRYYNKTSLFRPRK